MALSVSVDGIGREGYFVKEYLARGANCVTSKSAVAFSVTMAHNQVAAVDSNAYEVHLFISKNIYENFVYQLHIKSDQTFRVGWIFPVQALVSDQHDYAANPHWLNYATAAFQLICDPGSRVVASQIPNLSQAQDDVGIGIGEFFSDDAVIVCLSKNEISKINNFDILNYLPNAYMDGLAIYPEIADPRQIKLTPRSSGKRNKIVWFGNSRCTGREEFINNLYREILPYQDLPINLFYYFYQILELLISRLDTADTYCVAKHIMANYSNNHEIGKIIEEYSRRRNGRSKLDRVFNECSKEFWTKFTAHTDLNESLLAFLAANGDADKTSLVDSIYNTRNILFHNLRAISMPSLNSLVIANENFAYAIAVLLNTFKQDQNDACLQCF